MSNTKDYAFFGVCCAFSITLIILGAVVVGISNNISNTNCKDKVSNIKRAGQGVIIMGVILLLILGGGVFLFREDINKLNFSVTSSSSPSESSSSSSSSPSESSSPS